MEASAHLASRNADGRTVAMFHTTFTLLREREHEGVALERSVLHQGGFGGCNFLQHRYKALRRIEPLLSINNNAVLRAVLDIIVLLERPRLGRTVHQPVVLRTLVLAGRGTVIEHRDQLPVVREEEFNPHGTLTLIRQVKE